MIEIHISKADLLFMSKYLTGVRLSNAFEAALQSGEYFAKGKYPTGRFKLLLSEVQVKEILDLLGDLFATVGINDDDEPNQIGCRVESLIDIFQSSLES